MRILKLILLVFLFNQVSFSQSCLPEGITFNTQESIDSFQVNYPGCVEIEGNVYIQSSGQLNLNGLSVLNAIGGNFTICCSNHLTSLAGLENIHSIGGDLIIHDNPLLTSLSGLENISAASVGKLVIYDNPSLATCDVLSLCDYLALPNDTVIIYNNATGCDNPTEIATGCGITLPCLPFGNYYFFSQNEIDDFPSNYPGCTQINGNIFIKGGNISHLTGLNSVTTINGDLLIEQTINLSSLNGLTALTSAKRNILILNNAGLINLSGVDNLEFIGKDLTIEGNPGLTEFSGMGNLDTIAGHCIIIGNPVTDMSGFDALKYIGGRFTINYCGSLTHLEGLGALNYIGEGLIFYIDANLSSLNGLESLYITHGIAIYYCDNLTDITALSTLSTINGHLTIINNNSLNSLSGLDNITSIMGNISVDRNAKLSDLSGLEALTFIGQDLGLFDNPILINIEALQNVTSVGGKIFIQFNDLLHDLKGLNYVTSVGNNLVIGNNPTLTTLEALGNLNSIGGSLYIFNNDSLQSLKGLDNISANSITDLHLYSNNLLMTCEVKSICDYLANPAGTIEIYGNMAGCNNQDEVEEACRIFSIDEILPDNSISLYPNPTKGLINITFRIAQNQYVSLGIFDFNGREIVSISGDIKPAGEHTVSYDTSNLNPGVYFCRLTVNDKTVTGKIVLIK